MEKFKIDKNQTNQEEEFMVCWCCEEFVWHDPTDEGVCIHKRCVVPAQQIVCPHFIWRGGLTTKQIIPDYCIHYPNLQNNNR